MPKKPKRGGTRPGAGRPRSVGGTHTTTTSVMLDDRLNADLKMAAEELGISKGELLRRLARRALTEQQHSVIIAPKGERRGKK